MFGVKFKKWINLKRFGKMVVVTTNKKSKESSAIEAWCGKHSHGDTKWHVSARQ
jgi:hypothetical protein